MLNSILLQASPEALNIGMIVLIIAIFYFFMIRPQQKQQNKIKQFRQALKAGDKVMTTGGIFGKVRGVNNGVVDLEIANGVRISVALEGIVPSPEQANADVAKAEKEEKK